MEIFNVAVVIAVYSDYSKICHYYIKKFKESYDCIRFTSHPTLNSHKIPPDSISSRSIQ